MAVEVLTEFPHSFVAGDTIRVTMADSRFPSSLWKLKVLFQSALAAKSFAATTGTGGAYNIVIAASTSAKILPGAYSIAFVYTETSTQERHTVESDRAIIVLRDPTVAGAKSIARQTLEAMESAFLKLSSGSNLSVNFNGQSFTKRNLEDFQDAIDRQRAIVQAEDSSRIGSGSLQRIVHPL